MRRIKTLSALLLIGAAAGVSLHGARAQSAPASLTAPAVPPAPASKSFPFEIEGGYLFLRANEPPGSCNCFNMQGGNGTFGWAIKDSGFSAVGDVAVSHAGAIAATGYNLTLVSVTGGLRYQWRGRRTKLQPFAQALIGAAHGSGTGVEYPNPGSANSSINFAMIAGGGLDVAANRRFSVRLIDADLLMTDFDNLASGRQYNLRLGAGAVFHF